jgi:phasin
MFTKTDPFAFSPTAFTANGLAGMPESMRALAEKGLQQARDGYQQLKTAAESNNGAIEAACHSAAKGAGDYTAKWLEITKTNVEGAFDFAHALLGSKSMTDAVELASSHARKQFELLAAQSQDLIELGKKVASETVEPIKASATKAFNSAA